MAVAKVYASEGRDDKTVWPYGRLPAGASRKHAKPVKKAEIVQPKQEVIPVLKKGK